ncbi:MAG: FUSC family protein [Bdellovibrio sp.]|nr:FUSC family protein [Bdellovibrio sp.]
MFQLKKHYHEIIKMDSAAPPWPRMFLCAFATGIPLIVGTLHGSTSLSIYGALIGYLLALNDHLGELRHRIWVTILTFVLLMTGFATGFVLRTHPSFFQFVLAALVYWLGILGGDGAELERGVLFSVIGVVLFYFSPELPHEVIPMVLFYCFLGFATMVIGIPFIHVVKKSVPEQFAKLRSSFHLSLTKQREKHVHAACYTAMTLLSVAVAQALHIERGYWITVTVLLVMRAERTQSIYKTLQRLIGTALGVLLCDIVGQFISSPLLIIAIIILCGFILPSALKRNYLYASFVMTILIVFLLELSSSKFGDSTVPFLRLQATLIGCILSILGTALSKIISYVPNRR